MRIVLLVGMMSTAMLGRAQEITEGQFATAMDRGEALMKQGKHEEANESFLFVINNKEVLPSSLAYLFGQNSYHLGKYKQSINWLNKYIQIKGTQGRYYEPAVYYLQLAENAYIEIQRKRSAEMADALVNDDYDCGGLDNMICPVCHGSGVIIKAGYFDKVYKTCPYSAGEGYLTCEDYNLFMRGLLEPKVTE
ncbi:MAG: hypothetical protein AAGA85_03830 [Bacteroidota bacterium]